MAEEEGLLTVESTEQEESTEAAPAEPPHIAKDPEDDDVRAPESKTTAGERPANIPSQFWDEAKGEANLEGLAKAYSELRSKMDSGKHKLPEDGKYDLSGVDGLSEEDETLGSFLEIAKDEGLSQGAVERITKFYLETNQMAEEQVEYERTQEVEKLGRNAERIINSTNDWLGRLSSSGVLAEPELQAIVGAAQNATFVKALDKIRKSYNEPTIPAVAVTTDSPAITMDDIQSMMADPRYGQDMAFTKNVERQVYALHGESF